jgi:excisionase family DNA binding protein
MEKLLTMHEVARILGVSYSWLKKEVARGGVTHTRLGRAVRFSMNQVEELVVTRQQVAADRAARRRNRSGAVNSLLRQ